MRQKLAQEKAFSFSGACYLLLEQDFMTKRLSLLFLSFIGGLLVKNKFYATVLFALFVGFSFS